MAIFACAARVEAQTFSIDSAEPFDAYPLVTTVSAKTLWHLNHSMSNYLGTQQVSDTRERWLNLVGDSVRNEVIALEDQDGSGSKNLAFLGFFGGNGKTVSTFEETTNRLNTLGLSSNTVSLMMDAFDEEVGRANQVNALCAINNTNNDFSVSGKVILYRMTGRVRTQSNTERPFRALSAGGHLVSAVGAQPLANVYCTFESTGFVNPPTSQTTQTTQPAPTSTESTTAPTTTTTTQTTTEATTTTTVPTTTEATTEPPQTTTEATSEPPQTTTEATDPVQTESTQTSSEATEPVQTEPVSTDDPMSTSVTDVVSTSSSATDPVSTSATDPVSTSATDPVVTRPPVDPTSPTDPVVTEPVSPTDAPGSNGTDPTNPDGTTDTAQPVVVDPSGMPSGSVQHGASTYVAVVSAFTSLILASWSADYR